MVKAENDIKVGVALGGGFLCSLAHIGFLQVLEENGIVPDVISGVSMGAIVGAYYAGGYSLNEIENLAKKLKKRDLVALNFFRMLKKGVASSKKIEKFLNKTLKVKTFEELNVPLIAGATDIKTGKPYYFKNGDLVKALRASSSVPGMLDMVRLNGTAYIDGGVSDNVPFMALKESGVDVVIAIDCINPYNLDDLPTNTINTLIKSNQITQTIAYKLIAEKNKNCYDIYCYDGLKEASPDKLDFKLVPKIIENGRECAKKYLGQIKKIISQKSKNKENLYSK